MAEILEEVRENWGSRGGFVLAAIGSAVGLGNLWGFPYKLYSYGGGAFLIPYIIALVVVGIPMLILEFSLGHHTQRAAPDAFGRGHKRFEIVGWWGIILGFVIVTYYPVILAYCFSFLLYSIQGIFTGGELPWAGEGLAGVDNAKKFFFQTYLGYSAGSALGQVRWNIVIPLVIAWGSMYLCIFKGVKLVSKIVWLTVPLPWLMLLILTVRGLTLPGSMKGLAYYLDPVWSELAKPTTWRFAFGQVFFSLSLAFGVMITYASFLHRRSDINNNAAIIGISDFATSFVAGLAVFATLGAMAFATQQAGEAVAVDKVVEGGPGLAFVAFPYALAQLPYSAWFSFIFFFALVTLGIDSAFSITESVLASVVDKTGWRRSIVLPVMSLIGLGFGIVYVTEGGLNWLGIIDGFVNGTWGIALLGLLECAVLGWLWRIERLRRHANDRSDWKLGKWWNYLIRIFIPIVLGTLFFWNLIEDFSQQGGFFVDDAGRLILSNCVGMAVVGFAPVLSVIISVVKIRREDPSEPAGAIEHLQVKGRSAGSVGFVTASAAAVIIVSAWNSRAKISDTLAESLLLVSLVLGVAAIALSSYVVDKYNTSASRASWSARWAGLIGTMVLGGCIATRLSALTRRMGAQQGLSYGGQELSGVSYVILSVVFLIIIGGLGWCFYRALAATGKETEIQLPGEVGSQ